jgi:hypothetical protein
MEVFCKCNRWFGNVALWRAHLPCSVGGDPRPRDHNGADDASGADRAERADHAER